MKNESWLSVAIEFLLVVLGVFLGIAAANWNEERLEKRETAELLGQLGGELGLFERFLERIPRYYDSARGYARIAERGWHGDRAVDDNAFVIAVYQASQINSVSNNGAVWGAIFGADRLREIEDRSVRENLARLMTFDYTLVDLRVVSTRYREDVRKIIPDRVQSAIRARCGDRVVDLGLVLPSTCGLKLNPVEASATASALRARPDLLAELNWHRAAVDNQLANISTLQMLTAALLAEIGPNGRPA